jgi:hypothetical protein
LLAKKQQSLQQKHLLQQQLEAFKQQVSVRQPKQAERAASSSRNNSGEDALEDYMTNLQKRLQVIFIQCKFVILRRLLYAQTKQIFFFICRVKKSGKRVLLFHQLKKNFNVWRN